MYCEEKECDMPLEVDGLIQDEDEVTMYPCPCKIEGMALNVSVQYASVTFHWKHKQIEYWGNYGGIINIKYCPFCGRKL